jgi:hypothetical protein
MTTSAEVPGKYPVAINGRPYMVDPAGFRRESLPILRQQSDTSDLPSEASLNPRALWRRSQESWHHGSGQTLFDGKSSGTAADPERFSTSHNVNVWTRGQISLMPETVMVAPPSGGGAPTTPASHMISAANHLYIAETSNVYWASNPTVAATAWTSAVINAGEGAQTVRSLATDGYYIWAALGTSGLHRTIRGASSSTANVPAAPVGGNFGLVGYALGRLLVAGSATSTTQRNVLWEVLPTIVAPALSPAAAPYLMTHQNTGFVWTGITPGRNCAPGDQLVETTNRGRVRIDELVPGQDRLACYDPHTQRVFHAKRGQRRTGFGFERAVRSFTGDLVVMTTDETRARVTPNHKIPARWSKHAADAYCVYLMRRGDWWRVGKSRLHHLGRFGPAARCMTEKADAVWLLGVYGTEEEALLSEAYLSALYGITQMRFEFTGPEGMKALHARLAAQGSGERARRLLTDIGLEIEYPIWGVGSEERRCGLGLPFKLRAANLVSGWMEVPTYIRYTTEKLPWRPVTVTRERVVEMPVYSLEVEQYHSYVGDGQALYNCIYVFGNTPGDVLNLSYGVDQGGTGEVYKVSLSATDTSLTTPSPATYLPDGESIHDVRFYAGGVILATSRGLRLGQADSAGNIDYGPLMATTKPVLALEPQDRYVWFTGSNEGLHRADLGWFTDPLTPAWAPDATIAATSDTQALVKAAVSLTSSPNPVFLYQGAVISGTDPSGVYRPSATVLKPTGYVETGQLRFGTTESKTMRQIDVRHLVLPAGASVACDMKRDGGSWESVGVSATANSTSVSFVPGRSLYLTNSSATNDASASTPDSAALSVTGDLDLRIKMAADDWTPDQGTYISKWTTVGGFSYRLDLQGGTGKPHLYWSNDGSVTRTALSTVATGFIDGSTHWIRATLDVDNAAAGRDVKFYTSDDGSTWTQLGATVTQAGTTSIFDSTSEVRIGAFLDGGTLFNLARAKIHRVEIRNGIGGPVVGSFDAASVEVTGSRAPTTVTQTGATWTIEGSTWGWVTESATFESVELRLTLARGTDTVTGPTLLRWTAKVLPTPTRNEVFTLPLLLHSSVVDLNDADTPMDVPVEVTALKALETAGSIVEFQVGDETFTGFVEETSHQGAHWSKTGNPHRYVEGTMTVRLVTV